MSCVPSVSMHLALLSMARNLVVESIGLTYLRSSGKRRKRSSIGPACFSKVNNHVLALA
jgi:hypothetical protein